MKHLGQANRSSILTRSILSHLASAPLILFVLVISACSSPARLSITSTPIHGTPFTATPSITVESSVSITDTPALPVIATQSITLTPTSTAEAVTQTVQPTPTSTKPVVFAAIGDYGTGSREEGEVANLILSWQPDFIITLGDNNYPSGAANYMDVAVGQFFHSYIFPYYGKVGQGGEVNRFFPSLGNHDVLTEDGKPYLDYFTLPGNERYYDFTWGPVHLFALDNIETEPDGVGESSIQAQWLKAGLAASTSPWNIVYMHYPPYSSGTHGSTDWARWPYGEWGASAVLAGHDHTYERLDEAGLAYFVNGLGGAGRYDFVNILEGSQVRYNAEYGALRMEATETSLVFEFVNIEGDKVDRYELMK